MERRAERKRSEKLTVLQRLAAEDAATEAKEPKRKVSAAAGRKVVGALEVGASLAVSSALFGRERLHTAPKQMVDGTGKGQDPPEERTLADLLAPEGRGRTLADLLRI